LAIYVLHVGSTNIHFCYCFGVSAQDIAVHMSRHLGQTNILSRTHYRTTDGSRIFEERCLHRVQGLLQCLAFLTTLCSIFRGKYGLT
jgi:hypothetical protein